MWSVIRDRQRSLISVQKDRLAGLHEGTGYAGGLELRIIHGRSMGVGHLCIVDSDVASLSI